MKALAPPKYLIDAGPLVALFARRDRWHDRAKSVFFALGEPLSASELVIGEAAWNLGQNSPSTFELLNFID